MREYECKICGATAILKPDGNYQCAYCKQKYTIEQLIDKNPHVDLSFSVRLQMIRKAMEEDYDFPEAMKLCLEMAREYPEQQQLLWFSLLAENRITYIKNGEGRFVPTFLDPEKDSLQNSRYYKKLNEHYRTEADQIELQRNSESLSPTTYSSATSSMMRMEMTPRRRPGRMICTIF